MSSEDLYSEAVEAARAGNRELAREKLERLIEVDEENIKAWLLLARVSDTYEERRICLTTVLMLDPDNARAKEMLEKLEERQAEREVDEVIPGISRRTFTMFAVGVAVIVILGILIVTATIISSNRSSSEQNRELTQVAQSSTNIAITQTQLSVDGTQTQIALVSPTPSPTNTSELPPTATRTPTATGEPTLAPPMNLPGSLFGWSGFDVLSVDFLPIVEYDLVNGGPPQPLFGDTLGRFVTSANGERIIFVQYRQTFNDQFIVEADLTQTIDDEYAISNLSFLWSTTEILDDPDMVSVAPDGRFIVFTAGIAATGSRELITFDLPTAFTDTGDDEGSGEGAEVTPETTGNPPVVRLTNDTANYSYPVISPDGSQVAVVRTLTEGDNPGTDIVIIDIASRTQRELTTDRDGVMESMLRWHPNGREIIYAYNTLDNPDHNIGSVAIDGSGLSYDISAMEGVDQIFPVMSPDGRYLAYSSNPGGPAYDLFILDLTTSQLFQATNSLRDDDFARMWLP